MADQEIRIDCPCCKAEIFIDRETGGILSHKAYKEPGQTLEDFLKADKNRAGELESRFAEAKRLEDSRLNLLEKKFERARRNKDKLPEAPKPDIFWD